MKIYLDFDDTIAKSLPAIVKIVNQRYNKNVKTEDIGQWNFKDVCDIDIELVDTVDESYLYSQERLNA